MQHKYDENLDDRDCIFSWVALLEIKNYYSGAWKETVYICLRGLCFIY